MEHERPLTDQAQRLVELYDTYHKLERDAKLHKKLLIQFELEHTANQLKHLHLQGRLYA